MDSVVLVGRTEPTAGQTEEQDRSRPGLDFIHGLLQGAAAGMPPLADLLRALTRAFGAVAAGVAAPAEGTPFVRQREGPQSVRSRWPWEERPELLEEVRRSATAVPEQTADGSNWLFASSWAPASGELLL